MICVKYLMVWCFCVFGIAASTRKPNIVVIIADDLGWNDVGFHGSNEIPTPNIDALAYNGIILNRHYVLPTCSPSRTAFMTGKYPIRMGLQGDPRIALQPWAIPLKEKILPQFLKEHDYKTHLVGKWHLGFYKTDFTPTKRGFDSHYGYYYAWTRYNDSVCYSYPFEGIDARRNLKPAGDEFTDQYVTDVYTNEAVNIIKNHDRDTPLFLELSHLAVHSIGHDDLQVRDEKKNDEDFDYIGDQLRRRLAGALQALDESVGKIIEALNENGLLKNSVILFMSDNGGATEDPAWRFKNTASNWPLRGMKTSLHEGGVRGVAAIWSPLFKRRNYVSNEMFHISDWLPTFVSAAGGNSDAIEYIDGINQWNLLIGKQSKTDRKEVLVNVDFERNSSAIIFGNWKLIKHNETYQSSFADKYAGVSGREETPPYDLTGVLTSPANRLLNTESIGKEKFLEIREQAKIDSKCHSRISATSNLNIQCIGDCLYDLEADPCEFSNQTEANLNLINDLKNRLAYFERVTVPQQHPSIDLNANPSLWGGYWSPWLDESKPNSSISSTITNSLLVFCAMFFIFIYNLDLFFL